MPHYRVLLTVQGSATLYTEAETEAEARQEATKYEAGKNIQSALMYDLRYELADIEEHDPMRKFLRDIR